MYVCVRGVGGGGGVVGEGVHGVAGWGGGAKSTFNR